MAFLRDAATATGNFIAPQPQATVVPGQPPQPLPGSAPVDRWLPLLEGAAGALSTPSAGGAGPIIGHALGGYAQGRLGERQMAQDYAAKVAAAQALQARWKATGEHWQSQARATEAKAREMERAQKYGAKMRYMGTTGAARIKAAAEASKAGKADTRADDKKITTAMGRFDTAYRTATKMPVGQSMPAQQWLGTEEGFRTLMEQSNAAGIPPEALAQKLHLTVPTPATLPTEPRMRTIQEKLNQLDPSKEVQVTQLLESSLVKLKSGQPLAAEELDQLHAALGDEGMSALMDLAAPQVTPTAAPTPAPTPAPRP